jgi:hypothetical protein
MARKIILAAFLLVVAILPSANLLVKPESPGVLHLGMPGGGMPVRPPFPAPKNVSISLLPDQYSPDSIRISWDPVPGARDYRVYTAVAVRDSSVYVPFCEPVLDQNGNIIWEYKYSFHPTYGDLYTINYNTGAGYFLEMWGKLVTGGWTPDSGTLNGTTWTRAYEGERDRFFYVVAVR